MFSLAHLSPQGIFSNGFLKLKGPSLLSPRVNSLLGYSCVLVLWSGRVGLRVNCSQADFQEILLFSASLHISSSSYTVASNSRGFQRFCSSNWLAFCWLSSLLALGFQLSPLCKAHQSSTFFVFISFLCYLIFLFLRFRGVSGGNRISTLLNLAYLSTQSGFQMDSWNWKGCPCSLPGEKAT